MPVPPNMNNNPAARAPGKSTPTAGAGVYLIKDTECSFPDGNGYLVARNALGQNVAFCIHRGVLARHAPALEAIFGSATESAEGRPVVRVPETAYDVTQLLRVVYGFV